ncbi:coniferyl aldehyde dehydrogenase [Legionella pneumophila]|uniref:Aldehyde dehydrogenase n=1 Tax=Legionella pneumophila subsp. pascullei TaxID=91890 RepID=A0AAX2IVQ0_LEGPN|nr:coniferyl aldehyde dehydrogenase [Legionella pneumophila]AMP89971.1 coniferyl aldehyde dehydrogenase [Legionella pneumophila subsp. pascullei]AMP92362.1 aldehyde dehydrogenase [Legionella pneumophila subsp. pascullei]AMP95328.1 aldehyde dehydrogenase [Legionella pneumophila subsp. pascullei]SQG90224.1 alcohol dehydrogenase [Legionella pneumophila subsp. pascullei]VEH06285.1 alcohol dehydrogenase [Legionella pneumophila subsp. pascullei]
MELMAEYQSLHQQFKSNPYPSLSERKELLIAIKKILQTEACTLAEAINKDFTHRPVEETLFLEIFPTIKAINFCLKKMKKWMKKSRRNVSWLFIPAKAYVIPQPLGVVGIMVPWNYPVYLALVPAIYALAAGNKVMIKMSELSPHIGDTLLKLMHAAGLNHSISIINGDIELSKQFASLPFGHLMFTGSTNVGKLVMKAASDNLTPVTLELGGKSPAILSPTMNPAYFKRLFMGKLFNAAQTCIAPDYLLIPKGWEDRVEREFSKFINTFYPDLMSNEQYSSIISERHKKHLFDLVEDARSKGARIVEFGHSIPNSSKLPVFLLFGITDDMLVMKEEIFGPILPVLTYNSINNAVDFINSYPSPLALYYFGEDKSEIKIIQTKTLSGALTINETLMHIAIDDLPFGGVGHSGMGHYHGKEGFDTFSKLKPVFVQGFISTVSWLYPPYGALMRMFLAWIGGIKLREKS